MIDTSKPTLIECIPNFSEGRDEQVLSDIRKAIESAGAVVIQSQADPDDNRSLIRFAGSPLEVERAALAAATVAFDKIDMFEHEGRHPRIGALDVMPFIPVSNCELETCIALARRVASRMAEEHSVPVYLYGAAASSEPPPSLDQLRAGEFEDLVESIQSEEERKPDFGPMNLGRAGAAIIGARPAKLSLMAKFSNCTLEQLEDLASAIDGQQAGLKDAEARAIQSGDDLAVILSSVQGDSTALHRVVSLLKMETVERALRIDKMRILGFLPESTLDAAAKTGLLLAELDSDQIIDRVVADARRQRSMAEIERLSSPEQAQAAKSPVPATHLPPEDSLGRGFEAAADESDSSNALIDDEDATDAPQVVAAQSRTELELEQFRRGQGLSGEAPKDMDGTRDTGTMIARENLLETPLQDFIRALAAPSAIPGGGSAAAITAAMAGALVEMVRSHSQGGESIHGDGPLGKVDPLERLKARLIHLINEDAKAYAEVMDAYRLPRGSSSESEIRRETIQNALRKALVVPLNIMSESCKLIEWAQNWADKGKASTVSDAGVAGHLARAACQASALNVEINIMGLRDLEEGDRYRQLAKAQLERAIELSNELDKVVRSRIQGR